MKKGIKFLVLSALASLMMFAMICAKPIVAEASGSGSTPGGQLCVRYTDTAGQSQTAMVPGSLNYTWTGNESDTPTMHYNLIINSNGSLYLDLGLNFANVQEASAASGTCTYDFTFQGKTYHSTVDMIPRAGERFIVFCGVVDPADGNVTEGDPFVAQMYREINAKANEITLAAQGLNPDGSVNATKTVYYTAPSVNAEIIKALMKADGVSFVVTYNFAGFEFTSTITPEMAREMFKEDIAWYGPAYIAQHCGATWTGKTV